MKERLKEVLNIPSTGENTLLLFHHIMRVVNVKGIKVVIDEIGNILITKGVSEIYPCVTAHLDTVHSWGEIDIKETKQGVFTSPIGIGGDDKCGVFVCLELLKQLPILKVAFFQGEESGCRGSKAVDLQWFEDCGYIMGIDRRGNSDFIVTYFGDIAVSSTFKKTIKPALKEWKYSYATGTITDSFKLFDRKVGVCCCNMSCGYYDPHCISENVVADDVIKALFFCIDLIKLLGNNKYPHIPEPKKPLAGFQQGKGTCPVCKETTYSTYGYCWKCNKITKGESKEEACPLCGIAFVGNYCWGCKKTYHEAQESAKRREYIKKKTGGTTGSPCVRCPNFFLSHESKQCIECPDNKSRKTDKQCVSCRGTGLSACKPCVACEGTGVQSAYKALPPGKPIQPECVGCPFDKDPKDKTCKDCTVIQDARNLALKTKICPDCGSMLNNHGYCGKCKKSLMIAIQKMNGVITKCKDCPKGYYWFMSCSVCKERPTQEKEISNLLDIDECDCCRLPFKTSEITITKYGKYCPRCNASMRDN
jgi:hypothetical protein